MSAYPYSVSTGPYTVEQLEGEACAVCGQWFGLCPWPRPIPHQLVDGPGGHQTFRHDECPKGGATR